MFRHPLRALAAAMLALAGSLAHAATENADARITADVREAIFKRAEFAGDDVSVQTHDGVVYLHGLVDTGLERSEIEELVKAMPGVKRVVDSIEIRNDYR